MPKNVVYLENYGITYKGIKIYGSPICVSRQETKGKRYKSNAFERIKEVRFGDFLKEEFKDDTEIPVKSIEK